MRGKMPSYHASVKPGVIELHLFAVAGLVVVRRRVLPRLRIRVEDSEFSGSLVQSIMVSMIPACRLRLDAVNTGLPAVMWGVIVVGAFIGLSGSFFFKVEDAQLHGILVTLLAIFMGLVIVMILALDRPFRDDLGLRADPYQLIYDQLMKAKP